jgi:hypothetical protein
VPTVAGGRPEHAAELADERRHAIGACQVLSKAPGEDRNDLSVGLDEGPEAPGAGEPESMTGSSRRDGLRDLS